MSIGAIQKTTLFWQGGDHSANHADEIKMLWKG